MISPPLKSLRTSYESFDNEESFVSETSRDSKPRDAPIRMYFRDPISEKRQRKAKEHLDEIGTQYSQFVH